MLTRELRRNKENIKVTGWEPRGKQRRAITPRVRQKLLPLERSDERHQGAHMVSEQGSPQGPGRVCRGGQEVRLRRLCQRPARCCCFLCRHENTALSVLEKLQTGLQCLHVTLCHPSERGALAGDSKKKQGEKTAKKKFPFLLQFIVSPHQNPWEDPPFHRQWQCRSLTPQHQTQKGGFEARRKA